MHLALWKNPKTSSVRLYVNGFFPEEHSETKAWIEQTRTNLRGYALKTSGGYTSIAGTNSELMKLILSELRLSEETMWDDLVARVGSSTPKKQKRVFGNKSKNIHSGSRAEEALNLDIAGMKMPAPITIHVDHREPQEIVNLLDEHPLITVLYSNALDLGDFMVEDTEGNQLIIERKRCDSSHEKTDFESSIQTDGRLFDQSERMKFAAANSDKQIIPIFILEGDVYENAGSMLCQGIDGAISFLSAVQKISVLPTYNANHTAYLVAKLATHFLDGLYSPVTLHKAKPKVLFEQQRYILESMPGVSTNLAALLLETFGSVRNVMLASEKDLMAVKGLGKKKISVLLDVLSGN